MNERRDDTTKPEAESRPARGGRGRYYYDDATGYETYRPEEDGEEGSEDEASAGEGAEPAADP